MYLGMTTADFSDKGLGSSGAIIVGAWITHKDNGALTSLNLAANMLCGIWTNAYGAPQGAFDSSGMFSVHASFNGD
jgi:hypothetical protein